MPSSKSTPPIDPEISETNDIMHQWAYSFMPINGGEIYLVGYCRGCRNTFTCRVNVDEEFGLVVLTHTEIPRFGCAAPS